MRNETNARSIRGDRANAAVIERIEPRMLMSAGVLDPTFGSGGISTFSGSTGGIQDDFGGPIAVQPDGKVLVSTLFLSTDGFATVLGIQIRRLLPDGAPDTSFGTGGVYSLPTNDFVFSLLVQPTGKIVFVGNVIGRLNANGTLDQTFAGGKGIELFTDGTGANFSAGLQPNGAIVVDYFDDSTDIIRFSPDGIRDGSFGQNGSVALPSAFGSHFEAPQIGGIAIDKAGRIIVSVSVQETADPNQSGNFRTTYGIVRLLPSGNPDTSFGVDGLSLDEHSSVQGILTSTEGSTAHRPGAVAVAPNGTIYQIGGRFIGGEEFSNIYAYSSNGLSSGAGLPALLPSVTDLAIQADGKPVVLGSATTGQNEGILVDRFMPFTGVDGSSVTSDTSFDGTGHNEIDFGNQIPLSTQQITLTRDGGILLTAANGTADLLRLQGDPTPTVSGTVFFNGLGDGSLHAGEAGIPDVVVYADLNNNGKLDAGEPETTTGSKGQYTLGALPAGLVIIRQIPPAGERQSFPGLTLGDHVTAGSTPLTGANFADTNKIYIAGTIFNDANSNGKRDAGETGLGGWRVYADLNNDGKFEANENNKLTNPDGSFSFTDLSAGAYIFRAIPPAGWHQTFPSNNTGQHVTLAQGGVLQTAQFGFVRTAVASGVISGAAFDDLNTEIKSPTTGNWIDGLMWI